MRLANASAEKPPKTTEWTAPMRAHASIAIGRWGTIGMKSVTRSPFFTPRDLSTFATRDTSSSTCLYVQCCTSSPSSFASW